MGGHVSDPSELSPPEIYEHHLTPPIYRPWAETLVDLAGPRAGEAILDVACGPGIVARVAAPLVAPNGRVVGLDSDPAMLDLARVLAPSLEWQEADATAMPFGPATFDLVLSQQGIQFLPDPVAGMVEIFRVLKPGGRVALAIWGPLAACPAHAAVFEELGAMLGEAYAKPVAWSMPLAGDKLQLLSQAGFIEAEIQALTKTARFPSATAFTESFIKGASRVTRQALSKVAGSDRESFVARVAGRLSGYVDGGMLAVPMQCHIALAYRP
jgi:ubiquinone/menaquinone biosynthesis C-methylase UbiE